MGFGTVAAVAALLERACGLRRGSCGFSDASALAAYCDSELPALAEVVAWRDSGVFGSVATKGVAVY
jgi:hypothetical protein